MSAEEIKIVIEEIPMLIMYLVPGYIVLWTMSFILSKRIEKDSNLLIKSVVISYILISLGNLVTKGNVLDFLGYKISLITISLILGYAAAKFILSNSFASCLKKLGITRSIRTNIFTDIIDLERGLMVLAYLPNERMIYKGEVRRFEEKDDSEKSFLVLSNYIQFNYDGEEKINFENDNTCRILINTRDIGRMEMYYHPDSKII